MACVSSIGTDAAAATARVGFFEVLHGSRAANLPGESMRTQARVLRDRSEATRVLRAWGLDSTATNKVNFDRHNLIVVLAAYQPSGGFRTRVSRVDLAGREAVVTASVRYEGGQLATQSIERPWVVVAVKRPRAAVRSEARLRMR